MAAPSPVDVEGLAAMFPSIEKAVIVTVMEAHGGDSNRTIDALLVLEGQPPPPTLKTDDTTQVEGDSAYAYALQQQIIKEAEEQERRRANNSDEFFSSGDFKAVGEAFENMGKGWKVASSFHHL